LAVRVGERRLVQAARAQLAELLLYGEGASSDEEGVAPGSGEEEVRRKREREEDADEAEPEGPSRPGS
jgi:hypothetical protein